MAGITWRINLYMKSIKKSVLVAMIIAISMFVTMPIFAISVNQLPKEERAAANKIMNAIKTDKKNETYLKIGSSNINHELMEKAILDTYYPYYRPYILDYYETYENGRCEGEYLIRIKEAKAMYNYNSLLKKKAKTLVKKYTTKKMSKKKKATVLAKKVAGCLSYKCFNDNNIEVSLAKNLKKNKGACIVYSQLYQACCDQAKIDCYHVIGYAEGGYHSWTKCKIGKKWYYSDICFYDGTHNKKYIMSKKQWKTHKTERTVKVF